MTQQVKTGWMGFCSVGDISCLLDDDDTDDDDGDDIVDNADDDDDADDERQVLPPNMFTCSLANNG